MQLIVLGMHRSGTSIVTRILNLMGAYFGPEGISTGAGEENPKGFWERKDVRKLNDALLHSTNADWYKVNDFTLEQISEDARTSFYKEARNIILGLDAHRPWVLKEPRFCLLFPLWQTLLEVPVCIYVHRHPIQVAQSLLKRNEIPLSVGMALWERYALDALKGAAGMPIISVDHESMLKDPVTAVNQLYEQLQSIGVSGLRLPSDNEILAFIDPKLFRNRGSVELQDSFINYQQKSLADGLLMDFKQVTEKVGQMELSHGAKEILGAYERQQCLNAELVEQEVTRGRLEKQLSMRDKMLEKQEAAYDLLVSQLNERDVALKEQEATCGQLVSRLNESEKTLAGKVFEYKQLEEKLEDSNRSLKSKQELEDYLVAELNKSHQALRDGKAAVADWQHQLEGKNRRLKQEKINYHKLENKLSDVQHDHAYLENITQHYNEAFIRLERDYHSIKASARWKVGHAIIRFLEIILFRGKPVLVMDKMADVFSASKSWIPKKLKRTKVLTSSATGLVQLQSLFSDLEEAFKVLLESKRWNLGSFFVRIVEIVLFRKKVPLVIDHMEIVFNRFKSWHSSGHESKDVEQLLSWIDLIHDDFNKLIVSRRWFFGNMIVGLFNRVLLRDSSQTESDHMRSVFESIVEWRKAYTGHHGSRDLISSKRKAININSIDKNKNNKIPVVLSHNKNSIDDLVLLKRIQDYKRSSALTQKKVVVYTAISNNYDVLKIPEVLSPDWDYVCFTDRNEMPGVHPWQIKNFDYIDSESRRTARYVKTHPHEYFKNYEYSVWIDAHIQIKSNFLDDFVRDFSAKKGLFSAIPHPFRRCTYDEGHACLERGLDKKEVIEHQLQRYKSEGLPVGVGMVETGVLVRRHNDESVRKANIDWWREIDGWSGRDQISIMHILKRHGVEWTPLMDEGFSTRNHEGFKFFQHGLKETTRDVRYKIPEFLPKAFAFGRNPFWLRDLQVFDSAILAPLKDREIDIVVCVHNALDDVKHCVQSVLACMQANHRLILVDDGSDDTTRNYLESITDKNDCVKLLRHSVSKGYTKSANHGMKSSSADFVILLNSDTIVNGDWALKMLQVALSSPTIGVVGPMSNAASWQSLPLLRDPRSGMAFNDLPAGKSAADMDGLCEQYGYYGQFPHVPLINGFCYGIKREVIDAIGYFDEVAFPRGYGEEDDYSQRALEVGFIHAIATHTYVYHAKSKSFGKDGRKKLAKVGGKVLRTRHGDNRIQRAVETLKNQPLLRRLRANICTVCEIDNPEKLLEMLPLPEELRVSASGAIAKVKNSSNRYDLSRLTEIDPRVFPYELSLASITKEELDANAAFIDGMHGRSLGKIKTAVWMLPSFRNALAGGIRTLLLVAEEFSRDWGTKNIFVLYQTSDIQISHKKNEIQSLFPHLKFSIIYFEKSDDPVMLPESDVAFCSSWPTAYVLARYNKCKAKFYFMQDYESLFYPAGSVQGMIDQTYRFGFYCIANSLGIAEKYRAFSENVEYFIPGVDKSVFRPSFEKQNALPWQIVFYGRPNNARNAFALGLEALKRVKSHFGGAVRIVSVGAKWNPNTYGVKGLIENLGVLGSLDEVAELYRNSHVGLVTMLTPHPSYQPLEYMASGCVTVTNINNGTEWLFKNEVNALLTSVIPDDMARGIIRLLEDDGLRRKIVAGGLETVKLMDWDASFERIKGYVVDPSQR